MCAVDDAEPLDLVSVANPTARSPHLCDECARTIKPGEKYQLVKGRCNEEWITHRSCRHCLRAGTWLQVMCGGYPMTMLLDELVEHNEEYPTSAVLGGLIASVRDKWSDGDADLPDGVEIGADAKRCLEALVA